MGLLWRESASLILAAGKDPLKVLLLRRSGSAGNWAKRAVFPGGVVEHDDFSLDWVKHINKYVANIESLLLPDTAQRSPILKTKPNELAREIALKITAIRETFEETGFLVAHPNSASDDALATWRERLSKGTGKFFNMCSELDICPNVSALKMWSNWLTPVNVDTKRFDTVFFVAECEESTEINVDEREMSGAMWFSPAEAISRSSPEDLSIPTPQVYECARIVPFTSARELMAFAAAREKDGVELMASALVYCTDGIAVLFPGDDSYPENSEAVDSRNYPNRTLAEFRADAKNLRRYETTKNDFMTALFHNLAVHPKHCSPDSEFLQSVFTKRTGTGRRLL